MELWLISSLASAVAVCLALVYWWWDRRQPKAVFLLKRPLGYKKVDERRVDLTKDVVFFRGMAYVVNPEATTYSDKAPKMFYLVGNPKPLRINAECGSIEETEFSHRVYSFLKEQYVKQVLKASTASIYSLGLIVILVLLGVGVGFGLGFIAHPYITPQQVVNATAPVTNSTIPEVVLP